MSKVKKAAVKLNGIVQELGSSSQNAPSHIDCGPRFCHRRRVAGQGANGG
jgi:hypothetical protein